MMTARLRFPPGASPPDPQDIFRQKMEGVRNASADW